MASIFAEGLQGREARPCLEQHRSLVLLLRCSLKKKHLDVI